ncbi:MAG TPA: ATP-binding protein, partial [Chloroflexota bacterium]|nr:ATP-binding protein [Chloroflexota bacterium]
MATRLSSVDWNGPSDVDSTAPLIEMRAHALRIFLILTAIGYAAWHYNGALSTSPDQIIRVYTIVPMAAMVLGGAYFLLDRNQDVARWLFVVGTQMVVGWSVYVLDDPRPTMLHAAVVLMAAFVIGPLGGAAVGGMGLGIMAVLAWLRPDVVGVTEILFVGALAIVAVVGVWVVTSHLLMALSWYTESYARSEQQTREAREHRAELVEAKQQLNHALYRLERANAALRIAWKTADEAERSRIELATNISHEFRTPLNLIIGYSEMMLMSPDSYRGVPLPPAYRVDLNAVYRSAQHLLALADDVLDLARMEAGSAGLIREPGDVREVIRDAVALVRDYVAAKGLELRLDIDVDVPAVQMDRLRVRQVLLNLLTNASRLTTRGYVKVRLAVDGDFVRVEVSDTGPGIPPADLPRIFQRFQTGEQAQSDGRRGSGLGLPISRRFIELHSGDMGVESMAGQGATFWLTLPLTPIDSAMPTVHSHGAQLSRARDPEPVVVLACPDAELARILQRHIDGYRIELACDLVEAQQCAEEEKAIAILTDLDTPLPSTDGRVPVIRCPLPSVKQLARRLGVDDYLIKPISRENL